MVLWTKRPVLATARLGIGVVWTVVLASSNATTVANDEAIVPANAGAIGLAATAQRARENA